MGILFPLTVLLTSLLRTYSPSFLELTRVEKKLKCDSYKMQLDRCRSHHTYTVCHRHALIIRT